MEKFTKIILTIVSVVLFVEVILNALFGDMATWIVLAEAIGGLILFVITIFMGTKWEERTRAGRARRITSLMIAGIMALSGVNFLKIGFTTEGTPVADIDKMVTIWGDSIAGNRPDSKLDEMNINKNLRLLGATVKFTTSIVGTEYQDVELDIDTFTYIHGIKGGYEKETFEDVPYLIPYTVEGSDSAVIVIPGGGYGYKSMDGGTEESRDIALSLNKAGINAFVLWYRSNPYERPIPQLDLQRAVRYIRYHAKEYGIDSAKIGLIGFSAGGYQIGSFINQIQGEDNFPEAYQLDEIDAIDDSVCAVGMIYPALTYRYNVPMLFSSFNAEDVRNEEKREELLNLTDLTMNFNSIDIPQFVCYGTKDGMVGMDGAKEYIATAQKAGTEIVELVAEGQDHGFTQSYYMDNYVSWINECFAKEKSNNY
ncbi:alpha/beta hydrolase [Anaerosporobacter sp.]|uniref:alpha/beta hydrolase n=1 Tax=Anaerosporobacter sp. TaxID=1872529 RepID=UPI00286FA7D1|nr:alpha/beta hydrolase [Anaerosporobacter sp.]